MAIELSKSKTGKIIKGSPRRAPKFGAIKFIIAILIIIPIVFMFTDPKARGAFFDFQVAKVYERFNHFAEAKKYYGASYNDSGKTNTRAQIKYAEMCNRMRQYQTALDVTQVMIDFGMSDEILLSEAFRQNGDANAGLGIYNDAIKAYSSAVELKTDNYMALIGLGRAWRMKGDYEKSRKYLEDAVDTRNLRAPEAHYELGLTYMAENNNADALDEFELVIRQMGSRELRQKAQEEKINIISNRK